MRRFYKKHQQKINYLLVGGWNTVFGYCAFLSLYYLLNQYIHYVFLLMLSNILSVTNAYIGYKIFVFKTKGNYLREYVRFYMVYGVALILNLILLPLAVELLRVDPPSAQGVILWFTVVISYLGHKHFSFKKHTPR